MKEPDQIHVSRGMEVVGSYSVHEAIRLLELGTLKETDYYCHEGSFDVAQLVQLKVSENRREWNDDESRKALEPEASEPIPVSKTEDIPVIDEERRKALERMAIESTCVTRVEDLPGWLKRPSK